MEGHVSFKEGGSASDLTFARAQYPSKYDALIDAASRLGHKQVLVVPVEAGETPEAKRLCIRQALNRYVSDEIRQIKRFEVRKTEGGKLAIVAILLSRD
jgi:hypothetical protein